MDDGILLLLIILGALFVLIICIFRYALRNNGGNETIEIDTPADQHRNTPVKALLDDQSISLQPYVNVKDSDRVKTEKSDISIMEATEICRYCIGKGYKLCRTCKGDGVIPEIIDDEKGKEIYGKEICVSCDGNGRYLCEYCNGIPEKKFKRYDGRDLKSKESNKSDLKKAISVAKDVNTAYTVVSNGIKIVKALS